MNMGHLENSASSLEAHVEFLADFVHQNQEDWTPLYEMRCITLGETRCFYASQSGITRKSLVKVKNNLKNR